jgi:hypothetical protein
MARRIHPILQIITSFFLSLRFAFVVTGRSTMWAQASASAAKHSTQAADIVRDPAHVPGPIENRAPTTVHVTLTTEEVMGQLGPASGTTYR